MITQNIYFTNELLNWNKKNNMRMMPWKGEKDPYKIWLSEIILQQTRVEQGWEYYNRFVRAFPDIKKLSKAPETTVFKLWEGLGYYTRCKNLIATAKFIVKNYYGKFPDNYDAILNLKGIGPYTAAAIASFAFNLPYAVVDGNVFRVLARFFGINTAIDSTEGKKKFTALANELLNKNKPGLYNQALMDFGAVICKPKLPLCQNCPLQKKCVAFKTELVNDLPFKEKSIKNKLRWFNYFIIENNKKILVRKRVNKDIWENLYEFVLIETKDISDIKQLIKLSPIKELIKENELKSCTISKVYRQKLSHQTINGQFIIAAFKETVKIDGYTAVAKSKLDNLPFPKLITTYLKDKNVSLNLL